MTDSPLPGLPPLQPVDPTGPDGLETPEFLASLLADGDDELAAWVVGRAVAERGRAEVYDEIVRPAMELVGDRWERGAWSISVEHLASVALSGALSRLRRPDDPETRIGPTAVLAAPEHEQHTAGLACLAQVLADDGWHVENLGANVPADDLARFVSSRTVDLVALSIGMAERLPALHRTLLALRGGSASGQLPIMVGGRGVVGAEESIRGANLVAGSLAEAGTFAKSLLVAPRRAAAD
jgi:5-methyltetrahydrofolate--homocysteine methyltransferase